MGPVCSHVFHGIFFPVCNTRFLTASADCCLSKELYNLPRGAGVAEGNGTG